MHAETASVPNSLIYTVLQKTLPSDFQPGSAEPKGSTSICQGFCGWSVKKVKLLSVWNYVRRGHRTTKHQIGLLSSKLALLDVFLHKPTVFNILLVDSLSMFALNNEH